MCCGKNEIGKGVRDSGVVLLDKGLPNNNIC